MRVTCRATLTAFLLVIPFLNVSAANDALPTVVVLATGGTIAGAGASDVAAGYTSARVAVDTLIASVPDAAKLARLRGEQVASIGSQDMSDTVWLTLARRVGEVAADPGVAGIVITHGTDTLEETAYFLNLAVHEDVTVVVVGAQRPASGLSSDAAMNLVSAVRVAAAPEARGLGVLVVLNDEIQAAREVTKASTLRLETFRSADLGMLGYADPDGRIAIYRRPARRHAPDTEFGVRGRRDLPRVDIAYSYAGADGTAIAAFVAAGAQAIVVASMAPGVTTAAETEALLQARKQGALVVLSSRAGSGRVLPRTTLRERGFVVADNLLPQKARILAMLALTRTADPVEVQRMFDAY
jgi:L-asparaginase